MKNKNLSLLIQSLARLIAIAASAFVGYGFYHYPDYALSQASKYPTLIIATSAALVFTPIWIGYNRLIELEKVEGLSGSQMSGLTTFAAKIRKQLVSPFVFTSIIIVCMVALFIIGPKTPHANIVFALATPLFLLYMLNRIHKTVQAILLIDQEITKAREAAQKETARRELINTLREKRSTSPFQSDDAHLLRYRDALQDSPERCASAS